MGKESMGRNEYFRFSSPEISRQLNIPKVTIYKHLQKRGITRSWSEWQKGKEPWNKGLKGLTQLPEKESQILQQESLLIHQKEHKT